ncbi:carboxypeptidase-like regulatory domain-containing protein [Ferruginibacter sp. HRS2-29]|uniref:carboxypeptidase-like regulatory domain-containing protein n=1 Tax=Ferruginibacter sp. HRS2-29 TaxID=2487334 RepID=UPI0020CF44A2|nr:carboxypeptidase-like regulatory domain-containing protein [Ferruginibacter sp. HRS2-29]MCP9751851.1 hypothetical protein [Ferruginibacter sp. HRS2-29]
MRIFLFVLLLFFSLPGFSQKDLRKLRTASWQAFAYKISAAEAEQYMKWDSIPMERFEEAVPVMTFHADSIDESTLPVGNYVIMRTRESYVQADLLNISDLRLITINNRYRVQLDVRNKEGQPVEKVRMFMDNKELMADPSSKTFWLKNRKKDEAVIKVYTATDTLYTAIELNDDQYIKPVSEQIRENYHRTKIYRVLNWVPRQLSLLFRHKNAKEKYFSMNGYMIFNQPKYKLGDTVRFKSYLLDNRSKQYNKSIDIYLEYSHQGKNVEQLLTRLKPATPGAYFSEFVLRDTLVSGIKYRLIFKNTAGKNLMTGDFKVEDYVLDEINSTSFRSEKPTYYRQDTLRFFASAKDANGLNVLDADAELLLETSGINETYQDTVFVPDTLYRLRTKLSADGDTKFVVPTGILPKADLSIRAVLRFINSSNEVQEKTESVIYQYFSRQIFAKQKNDSVYVAYLENGESVPVSGIMQAGDQKEEPVNFPATIKINGLAETYQFRYKAGSSFGNTFEPSPYLVGFNRISSADTLGFILDNPYQVPVYYTVLDGQKIIATGRQSDKSIRWIKIMSDRRQYYSVRWQYMWNGREKKEETSIGLLYKILAVKIDAKDKIFPGEKDSVKVTVTDYKGRPAADVNLTAVGYNNQLSKDIKIKEPGYRVTYRGKKYIEYPPFEQTELDLPYSSDLLANNKKWIKKFGLDSMLYYQFLFPPNGFKDEMTLLHDFIPQVSVNLVKDGLLQEIYLLHINRQFRYYNGVTDTSRYAFEVYPGYAQFVIRTKDQEIKLDSIYIQPGFKHDLVFDLDNLPANSTVKNVTSYWSKDEMQLLENSIWRLRGKEMPGASVWQGRNVSVLNGGDLHILGPFERDSLYFFDSTKFDIAFKFEPGYEYSLSKKVTRLEKRNFFVSQENKIYLPVVRYPLLKIGDTLMFPPVIRFAPEKMSTFLRSLRVTSGFTYDFHRAGTGKLMIKVPRDSTIRYVILKHADSSKAIIISNMYSYTVFNLDPGQYRLLLVTWNNSIAEKNVAISVNGTEVEDMRHPIFSAANALLEQLYADAAREEELARQKDDEPIRPVEKPVSLMPSGMIVSPGGGTTLTVNVIDGRSGGPIPFALVTFEGYKPSGITDPQGNYYFSNLKKGNYTLVISATGYMAKKVKLDINNELPVKINVSLLISSQSLQEVVVTSLGIQRQRKDLAYSVLTISAYGFDIGTNITQSLQGRVAGLNITSVNNGFFDSVRINLRGIRSLTGNPDPLLIIDGIITPMGALGSLNPEEIAEMLTLSAASASAIYGPEAANGAIVVTTKRKTDRKIFRDYAFWQPNMITDKNGNASFEITYPDNITGWKNYVFAMDKKNRVGKTYMLTRSYKPMVAQLNMPLFLTEGDSCYVVGKASNYTEDKYSISTSFKLNDQLLSENKTDLSPSDAHIDQQLIHTSGKDTLSIGYELKSTTGFKDGEERKLPVLKKGTEETVGDFWVLQKDTAVNFKLSPNASGLNIYAQNNTLDVLLDELEHLKNYPHQCMEQTTSKLKGLALKKQVYGLLKKDFTEQKLADQLLAKIQKAQLYDGGWSWWPNGKANFEVTNYILQVLLSYRSNPLVETNIRNGFLYLQNLLPSLRKDRLMAALFTLSEGQHEMNFETWLKKINADSIGMYAKWQKLRIMQRQKMAHASLLEELMSRKKLSILGGIYWGEQTYNWSNNEIATTVLAFKVLKEEPGFERSTGGIIQYFLERRRSGYWANTVESASIVGAILQDALDTRTDITKPAIVSVSGDTVFNINKFPFEIKWRNTGIRNLNFDKRGGGIVYLTAYQKMFVADPLPVTDNFIINTYFLKNGQKQQVIKSGEKIKMVVEVNVLKESEYVMLEVPIPAGCIYSDKNDQNWYEYREASKDKVMIFKEFLGKGIQTFEIELAPRYNGVYNINPAKAELMYYPTFFGRNEMKKVNIKP